MYIDGLKPPPFPSFDGESIPKDDRMISDWKSFKDKNGRIFYHNNRSVNLINRDDI